MEISFSSTRAGMPQRL